VKLKNSDLTLFFSAYGISRIHKEFKEGYLNLIFFAFYIWKC